MNELYPQQLVHPSSVNQNELRRTTFPCVVNYGKTPNIDLID